MISCGTSSNAINRAHTKAQSGRGGPGAGKTVLVTEFPFTDSQGVVERLISDLPEEMAE